MKENNFLAITYIMLGMTAFALQDTVIRLLAVDISILQVMFARSVVALILLTLFLKITKKEIILKTAFPKLSIFRTVMFILAKINITVLKIDNLGNAVFNIISFLVIFKKRVKRINATTLRANITCRIEISTASNLMTVSCNANAVMPSMIYVIARKLFSFI